MTRSPQELMRCYLQQVAGEGRLDLIDEIAHEDMVDEANQAFGGPPGRAGLVAHVKGFRKHLNDIDLRIERIGPERAEHFGRVVCPAFGMTEAAIPFAAGLASDERWHLFVSYEGDEPAGAGALMIDRGVGWLEWGATRPEFRRRGSQGAVMSARIQAALDAGCEHMFTETGEAVEGDPQHSYRNIQRYGFREGPLRENWVPAN